MTASTATPKKKEEKSKEDKINEIIADGATTVIRQDGGGLQVRKILSRNKSQEINYMSQLYL